MWLLKTVPVPVEVGDPCMIKKETDKRIKKIPGRPSQFEIQELHFAELLVSLGEYN